MNGILDLRETSANNWTAKYQGNYGVYTIRITIDGSRTTNFSCSCPSDYSPCKHIEIIEEAVAERIAQNKKNAKNGAITAEKLLKDVSLEELRDFIVRQAKYNPDIHNALLLEFAPRVGNKRGNKYTLIIRTALQSVGFYEDDYYNESYQDIDALDQWFIQAEASLGNEQYREAILVCKACIEEFAAWLAGENEDISYMVNPDYQSKPFDMLEQAAKQAEVAVVKELYDWCLLEMNKQKYAGTDMRDGFHRLFMVLALSVDPASFIALQDSLLAGIADKSSDEAETILRRKIDFYQRCGQPENGWKIIEENVQIEYFRRQIVEKKIANGEYAEAKKLINDFIETAEKKQEYHANWDAFLLEIAGKENDKPAVRKLSYGFIKDHFSKKHFDLYKATFKPAEWKIELENLLKLYDGKRIYFSQSVASVLAAENAAERLMNYVEAHLSASDLEQYYRFFAPAFPEKTLELFQRALDGYAEHNLGRSHYAHLLALLKKMSRIKGGKKAAAALVENYKARYKRRRAMLEVLGGF
jgi:hypothetical protein